MSSSPTVPPIKKDPSIPASQGRNLFDKLPPEMRNKIYRRLMPKNATISINHRADLPAIIQNARGAIRSEASDYFFGNNKMTISRTVEASRMSAIIDNIKNADNTSLQWARNWQLSCEVRMPPIADDAPEEDWCICAQSIIGTITFVASARRLTGEAMPHEEQTACQDKSTCDYRKLMRQVREAYDELGVTMQRLFPGTIVNPLSIIDPDLDSDSEDESEAEDGAQSEEEEDTTESDEGSSVSEQDDNEGGDED